MRHRIDKKKLNRKPDHRALLLKNLITAFAKNGKLKTTLAKAKYLQAPLESLISSASRQTLASRRQLYNSFTEKAAAAHFFTHDIPLLSSTKSGFTRLIKLGPRRGDGAEMARLEWVTALSKKEAPAKKNKAKEKKPAKVKSPALGEKTKLKKKTTK